MNHKPGVEVPADGVYWCTVCKRPEKFQKGQTFPPCKNLCGRGFWQIAPQAPKQPQA